MSEYFSPIGVNQPPASGTDYPFVNPPDSVKFILLDLYLSYLDESLQFIQPFKIYWMYGFGLNTDISSMDSPTPIHPFDLVIKDKIGQIVFNTANDDVIYSQSLWGANRVVVKYYLDDKWLQLVAIRPDLNPNVHVGFNPNAELDARTTRRINLTLSGIKIGNQVFKNLIEIEEGHNIKLQDDSINNKLVKGLKLTITAQPGAGKGRQPPANYGHYLSKINQIGPDKSGNFTIQFDGCCEVHSPKVVSQQNPRTLLPYHPSLTFDGAVSCFVISNHCSVCCPCEHYVNTYEGIRSVKNYWGNAADALVVARNLYHQAANRWKDNRECRVENPLKLHLSAEGACTLNLAGLWCNMSKACVSPAELIFEVYRMVPGIGPFDLTTVFPDSITLQESMISHPLGSEKYEMQDIYPRYKATFDKVEPQQSIWARFRLSFDECNPGDVVSVTLRVHFPDPPPAPDGTIVTFPQIEPGDLIGSKWWARFKLQKYIILK